MIMTAHKNARGEGAAEEGMSIYYLTFSLQVSFPVETMVC